MCIYLKILDDCLCLFKNTSTVVLFTGIPHYRKKYKAQDWPYNSRKYRVDGAISSTQDKVWGNRDRPPLSTGAFEFVLSFRGM